MVIVVRRQRHKPLRNLQKEHDFSHDQNHCGKCGMARQVWDDTRVPCPGKPYSANTALIRKQ